jgi:pimeloyl-ACP methyl ester carboxylesterase
VHQQIRFCTARDGARLAWASHGSGPPLVKAANWLTHLEYDWESPVWRYWLEGLAQSHSVIRYDERGCGLSDKDVGKPSIEQWVSDLETVVDAGAIERFTLLGISQGAAIAIAYAVRHPERVERIVLVRRLRTRAQPPRRTRAGPSPCRGDPRRVGRPKPGVPAPFHRAHAAVGTPEQMAWYVKLRVSGKAARAAAAARFSQVG